MALRPDDPFLEGAIRNIIREEIGGSQVGVLVRQLQGAVPKFKVGSFQSHASTGDKAITGVGFTPQLVTFSVTKNSTDHTNEWIGWGWGAMDANSERSWHNAARADAFAAGHEWSQANCIFMAAYDNTNVYRASFVSFDSDGFTINVTDADATWQVMWTAWG